MASQITRPEGESPLVTGTVKECFGPTPPGGFRDRPSFPLYLIFSFVPLFLLGVFAWYGLSLEEVFRRSMAARTLERELDTLIQETDPLNIFAKWFKRINNDLWQKPGSVEEKTRELQKVIPPGPLAFSCYRFDASGTIVVPGALVGTLPDEVTRLWKILQGKRYERRLMTLTSDRWLGVNFPLAQIIRRPGEVFHTTTSNGLGLIGVFREGPASGTPGSLFIIPKEPGIVQILRAPELRELVPSFSQPTRLAVTEPDGITREIGQPADHSGENLLASFPAEFRSELPPNQAFLRVVKRSGAGTFHALRFVPEADLGTYRSILSAILAISGIILILAFPRVSALFARRFISIQWKIPLLFFYSIVIPMAGAALLGYQTLRDRRETMEAEVHQEALRILAGLDSGFILEKKHALRQFEGFRRDVRQATATSTLASLSENLRKTGEITFAEIRDRFARTLYTTWNADEKVRLALLMDTIAKVCLKRFHPSPPTARGALDLTVAEVFTQSFFLSPMVGWPRILERPEELHSLKFAGRDLFLYWSILTDARNPSAYIQLQQNVSLLQRLYLRQRLRDRMAFRQGEFRFLVWNELSGDLVPKDQVFGGEVRNFFQRLRITQETLREEIRIGETRYLGSGFPGRQLGGHYLVALYPMAIFDTALRNFTVLFFLGTLGICFLVLVFGLALSESFLIPIQELSDGVLALRERDVSRRVAVSIGDELGALAATFNQTLDGLQEMLLAHEVQRELIPHELPAIPGYQAKLMSHPARDLGGDYCDMQPLAEGRYCLVIGDATGHNVSSALVMAMAKAGVLDFLAEGSSPLELMKRLNILFFRHFQRKVNMTFFAAVLEPATGRLRFSNAGHPFPVLIDQEGKVSRLKLSHPPLGFSSRDDRFQENEVTIAPGSMVFFFTDLLMEICDPHGVPWGSKRLIEFVRERRAQAPGRLSEDLFQMARDYSGSDSFEDDFTLMILKRDSIGS